MRDRQRLMTTKALIQKVPACWCTLSRVAVYHSPTIIQSGRRQRRSPCCLEQVQGWALRNTLHGRQHPVWGNVALHEFGQPCGFACFERCRSTWNIFWEALDLEIQSTTGPRCVKHTVMFTCQVLNFCCIAKDAPLCYMWIGSLKTGKFPLQ